MIWSEVGAINFFKGLDSASAHVFWKDLQNPLAAIKIVSSGDPEAVDQTLHAFNGANGTNGIDISDDGSIVIFTSSSTNAYTGASGRQIIACRMLTVGYPCQVVNSTNTSAADQTGLISTGSTVEQPKISADGSFAIWIESSVSYGYSNYSTKQVFGKSLATGDENVGPRILSSLAPTTLNQTGQVANAAASAAIVNSDGSKFVFTTAATNLCTNCGPAARVQVYLGTVGSSPTFQMLSSKTPSAADQVNDRGNAAAGTGLAWSGNNRYVAFTSLASNLNATYTMPAFLQVYRVDLNDLGASPILISTSDATESNQSGFASGVAVANALAMSNDGNRIYFGSAFAGYLASTASISYRRIWERNVSNASLTLVTYRGGSVSDVANIFKATHCDVNAASKEAVPKISMICSGADQMPGLTSKANAFIKDMSN